MIDPNLTHLNVSLNVSLIQPLPPWWTSLINPVTWLPLMIVLIGAFATYFFANQLESRKDQYNLKVKIYFECLDITHIYMSEIEKYMSEIEEFKKIDQKKIQKYMSEIEKFEKIDKKIQKIDDLNISEIKLTLSEIEKLLEKSINEQIKVNKAYIKVNEAIDSLNLIRPKLQVVCSNDVMDAFLDFVQLTNMQLTKGETDRSTFLQKQLKLTQAIRRDLMPNERVFFALDPERLGNKSDKDFEGISDDLKSEITKVYEDTKNTKKKHWWQFLR